MKQKILSVSFMIILVLGIWAASPTMTFAETDPDLLNGPNNSVEFQTGTTPISAVPTVLPPPSDELLRGEHITFSQLGVKSDVLLNGPYDSYFLRFDTPANWKLKEGSEITFKLAVRFLFPQGVSSFYGAKIDVYFDNLYMKTIMLEGNGDIEVKVPILMSQYTADPTYEPNPPGVHTIYLFMDASQDCQDIRSQDQTIQGRVKTSVVIKMDTYLDLPHDIIPLETDLAALPSPIYQQNMIIPSQALLIVPDQPSISEIQAAMTVMTGLARMTNGDLKIETISVGQLTDALVKQANLIFVGKADAFTLLSSIQLPIPLSDNKYTVPYGLPNDGIIQYIASPWNEANAVLVVSGNNDMAVVKASTALSSGAIKGGEQPNIAIVTNIQQDAANLMVPEDRTFADLGYQQKTKLVGLGKTSAIYDFYIPPDYVTNSDAYLELVYSHTALLDYESSGFELAVNDINFGSVAYSAKTTASTTQKFSIPPYAIHSGRNTLEVRVNHSVSDACIPIDLEMWTQILNTQSILHIPLVEAPIGLTSMLDLKYFPFPFSSTTDLSDIVFVLPPNDDNAFKSAMKIAYYLGEKTAGNITMFEVAYSNALPDSATRDKNLIIIGKPSTIQMIADINQNLPVPFNSGSNVASETTLRISYALPDTVDVGYLELMNTPWNSMRVILAVLGSSDVGVQWAADALINSTAKLSGNYATTNGKDVFSSDTRQGTGTRLAATAFPQEATPVVDTGEFLGQSDAIFETPPLISLDPKIWIPFVIIAVSFLIVLILVFVLISNVKLRSSRGTKK